MTAPVFFLFAPIMNSIYVYTSSEARLWRASVLQPAVDGLSVKVL